MSTQTKTLAKSLHTVTALADAALFIRTQENDEISDADAMQAALELFGYAGANDPYGLADKALVALNKWSS